MKGKYVGLPIGGVLSTNPYVVVSANGINANGVASLNYISAANKNANYAVAGQAGINYSGNSIFSKSFTSSGSATTSADGKPFFSARGTSNGSATVFIDAESVGQSQFIITAVATADAVTQADKDGYFEIFPFADTAFELKADAQCIATSNGAATTAAIGTVKQTNSNKTLPLTNYTQITTQRTTNTIITASNPKQKVITQQLDAA